MNKRNVYDLKFAIISVVIVIGVLFILFRYNDKVINLLRTFYKGKGYYTTDVTEYGEFEGFRGYSKLYIFPEQISENVKVEKYLYKYDDTLFDATCQIYLECVYNDEGYEKELKRLSNIKEEYRGEVQRVSYEEEAFRYPAFVTINADNHCYEYALILDGNKIVYIFLQFTNMEAVEFPLDYLPYNYEMEDNCEGESIYIFYDNAGYGIGTY